jgi:hypothetical protein
VRGWGGYWSFCCCGSGGGSPGSVVLQMVGRVNEHTWLHIGPNPINNNQIRSDNRLKSLMIPKNRKIKQNKMKVKKQIKKETTNNNNEK